MSPKLLLPSLLTGASFAPQRPRWRWLTFCPPLTAGWLLMMMICHVVFGQEARKSDNQYIGYCTATEDCSGPQNAIWYNPDLRMFSATSVTTRTTEAPSLTDIYDCPHTRTHTYRPSGLPRHLW